jgi:6-phospho-beta-glucosidase
MDAIYNDRKEVWYVNVPNQGTIADSSDNLVVQLVRYVDRNGVVPLVQGHMQ